MGGWGRRLVIRRVASPIRGPICGPSILGARVRP